HPHLSAAPESNERPDAPHSAIEEARRKLARALSWTRHALLWEKLWPRLASALVVFGLFLTASWLGLWIALPPFGRVTGVLLFALLLLAGLSPLLRLRRPGRADPPAYTGRAPILLPGIRHDEPAPGETAAVLVPAGSELVVRATGLSSIDLVPSGGLAEQAKDTPARTSEGGIERRFLVTGSGTVN